jgi:hypothetical protein
MMGFAQAQDRRNRPLSNRRKASARNASAPRETPVAQLEERRESTNYLECDCLEWYTR